MEAKIEAFEMWLYRRIMRISWKEMKNNAEVLKMIGLKNMELVMSIKKKKLAYYGHGRRHLLGLSLCRSAEACVLP